MMPDPQPRHTEEQEALEQALARRASVLAQEAAMRPLALRVTQALRPLLAKEAHELNVNEDEHLTSIEVEPLLWVQLAEITKCLSVHDMLPSTLSTKDYKQIRQYAAHRWFDTWRHERLIYLAMNTMVQWQCDSLKQYESEPFLTLWSAHDSTLIGLLCAYHLEQPAEWPEYASYFVMELLEDDTSKELYVRFSINGQCLHSRWNEDEEPRDMISLRELEEQVQRVPPSVDLTAEV